jgi:hypothetical protein
MVLFLIMNWLLYPDPSGTGSVEKNQSCFIQIYAEDMACITSHTIELELGKGQNIG